MEELKYFTGDKTEDDFTMVRILDEIDFISGSTRNKMYTNKKGTGGSMLYGLTWKGYLSKTKSRTRSIYKGLYQTKVVDDHPELDGILKEYKDIYFPHFDYKQVQLNKNFLAPKHTDSENTGQSILIGFGDYTGGKAVVNFDGNIKKYDVRESYLEFNGSKYEHWVEPFEGTRYSIVFFDNLRHRKLTLIKSDNDPAPTLL